VLFLKHLVQRGVVNDVIIQIIEVLGAGGREEKREGGRLWRKKEVRDVLNCKAC